MATTAQTIDDAKLGQFMGRFVGDFPWRRRWGSDVGAEGPLGGTEGRSILEAAPLAAPLAGAVVSSAMPMPAKRALLLLADIGGYTRFMRLHRMNLAHSQEITRRLLEAMLDAVPSLTLVEVEGDALFLYTPHEEGGSGTSSDCLSFALEMYRAFHARQEWMVAHNLCVCDACRQIGRLRVKFVAHLGEVETQTIKDRAQLVGVDVIAAHRMLKNTVPPPEYVLMSEPIYELSDPELRGRAVCLEQEFEGLGTMPTYFVDLTNVPIDLPPAPEPTLRGRVRETLGVGMRAFPRVIGLRPLRTRDS